MRFEVVATDPNSGLRAGLLHTLHGTVETPTFMPVGTLGTVKSLTPADVRATGAEIVTSGMFWTVTLTDWDVTAGQTCETTLT